MHEREVRSVAGAGREAVEKVCGGHRRAVRHAPQDQPRLELVRLQPILAEDVYVGTPLSEGVEALGPEPVVVTGSDEDRRRMQLFKDSLEKRAGVGRRPVMLEQISGAQQGIGFLCLRELHDVPQCLSESLATMRVNRTVCLQPDKGGIQVQPPNRTSLTGPSLSVPSAPHDPRTWRTSALCLTRSSGQRQPHKVPLVPSADMTQTLAKGCDTFSA